jgi:GH25 family lysozyme M1 (1,4-beta-N-acetylmuramidase)
MLLLPIFALLATLAVAEVPGFDISNYQTTVDFPGAYAAGSRFVIIKATEGYDWKDRLFAEHYKKSADAGFICGGYHFARLDGGTGAMDGEFFVRGILTREKV